MYIDIMGITIVDPVSFPFIENVSNTYIAFGTVQSYVYCSFDESNTRQYMVSVPYGIYFDKDSYVNGLQPLTRISLNLTGNDATVSNIYNFITEGVLKNYANVQVIDDGIEN